MPFHRVLTKVYNIRTDTLFELSPLYILKHNTFQGQGWPHFNPLNAKLNPICHLLGLLGGHHILHVSKIRVKACFLQITATT